MNVGLSRPWIRLGPLWPILVFALVAPALVTRAAARPLVEGLDHVPVAVHDLDQAASDFSRLGFMIKPGRLHGDGIRNMHVKFPNGGGIELITASSPTDTLAQDYVDWLKGGDGPSFWSVYSPDLASLTALLNTHKLSPRNDGDIVTLSQSAPAHRLFFGNRLPSPTDGPQYWAHPNTAYKLADVWLAGTAADQAVLPFLGAKRTAQHRCAPFERRAAIFVLPGEGDHVLVAPAVHRSQDRPIVGLTVLVKNITTAREILDANDVPYMRPEDCNEQSIWIRPADAHGLWLELYEKFGG